MASPSPSPLRRGFFRRTFSSKDKKTTSSPLSSNSNNNSTTQQMNVGKEGTSSFIVSVFHFLKTDEFKLNNDNFLQITKIANLNLAAISIFF